MLPAEHNNKISENLTIPHKVTFSRVIVDENSCVNKGVNVCFVQQVKPVSILTAQGTRREEEDGLSGESRTSHFLYGFLWFS